MEILMFSNITCGVRGRWTNTTFLWLEDSNYILNGLWESFLQVVDTKHPAKHDRFYSCWYLICPYTGTLVICNAMCIAIELYWRSAKRLWQIDCPNSSRFNKAQTPWNGNLISAAFHLHPTLLRLCLCSFTAL